MRARKRFGQHFLADATIVRRIIDAIDPQPGQALVEIGPGHGVLTHALLGRCERLRSIEIDRDLAAELRVDPRFGGRLDVIEADALSVDFGALQGTGAKLRLVGNLPYNISTPLLFHVLEQRAAIADAHFMLQKEVVARMAAPPGSRTYGRLSVMLAPYCRVEALFDVAPGAFRPPPKVTSSLVRLIPHAAPPFAIDDPAIFARVVSAAFSQRRKKLRNALGELASPGQLSEAGIDPDDRAERIPAAAFAALANRMPR
jgi:16S rRNA (adenine1518-N6/adenine1519-N6)-dimethyltransferase